MLRRQALLIGGKHLLGVDTLGRVFFAVK